MEILKSFKKNWEHKLDLKYKENLDLRYKEENASVEKGLAEQLLNLELSYLNLKLISLRQNFRLRLENNVRNYSKNPAKCFT